MTQVTANELSNLPSIQYLVDGQYREWGRVVHIDPMAYRYIGRRRISPIVTILCRRTAFFGFRIQQKIVAFLLRKVAEFSIVIDIDMECRGFLGKPNAVVDYKIIFPREDWNFSAMIWCVDPVNPHEGFGTWAIQYKFIQAPDIIHREAL